MDIKKLQKVGIITGSVLATIYAGFLILPFCLGGLIQNYVPEINKIIADSTGLKSDIQGLRVVTTPKLTAGINLKSAKILTPTDLKVVEVENVKFRLSLLPLLIRRIEIDKICANNFSVDLRIEKDGGFEVVKYLPAPQDEDKVEENQEVLTELPFGFKLSNKLPDVKVKEYSINFVDNLTKKSYEILGNDFKISDFVFNKKIKVSTDGQVVFDTQKRFSYDVKLFNKIMPDMDLSTLVFSQQPAEESQGESVNFNIIDLFKTINANKITADFVGDLKTSKDKDDIQLNGNASIENLSLAVDGVQLPAGSVVMNFANNKISLISKLHTSEDDSTEVVGDFRTGKNPKIDLTFRSKAKFDDLINMIDSVAKSVGYKDFETLSAKGGIDADFNLKSDLKKINSSGYFNVDNSSITYKLYNIFIDKINAHIDFSNDMVKITDSGFSILSQPLSFYGEIQQNADAKLYLTADKLPIKGIILAAGQIGLLKDNEINSGTISMEASLIGKLKNPEAKLQLSANNIDIKNKPAAIRITNNNSKINIEPKNNAFVGDVIVNDLKLINPLVTVKAPSANVSLDDKNIDIKNSYILLNNSKINYSGKIADYMTNKLAFNIEADGAILTSDIKSMIPKELSKDVSAKGQLPLKASVSGNLKSQEIKAQVVADANNNLSFVNISNLQGQKSILNGEIKIANDSLKLSNTGVYKNTHATPILVVKGGVNNLSGNMKLDSLGVETKENVIVEIPGFKNSKAIASANIITNGYLANPVIKGNLSIPTISIPTIKTTIKDTILDFSESVINAKCGDIAIDNSKMNGSAKISTNFANGVVIKSLTFNSSNLDADTLMKAMEGLPQGSATSTSSNSAPQDLGVVVNEGKGSIAKLKSGGIVADNLTSDFYLKNNTLYLNNIKGGAFSGNIDGKVSYNLLNGSTYVDMKGQNLNATTAIEGAAGIKNALTGKLNFGAKVSLKGFTEKEMMQSLKGKVNFDINDGTLGSIGKLDYILNASNITSNSILKAAVNSVAVLPTVQKTAKFKEIKGVIDLGNSWATLNPISLSGSAMSYYVTGKYNLLTGMTNVTVLGRLSAGVVAALGPLGDLSVDKLTAYIPKFGALTSKLLNAMTTNPRGENISAIPPLTSGDKNYKDFKVLINGNIASTTAVKSFKWLSTCDTSEIEQLTVKEQIQATQNAVKDTYNSKVEAAKNKLEAARQEAQTSRQQMLDAAKNLKNLKDKLNTK